jgi:tRNA A37 threonylcarbamoyladenosine synthetase subunit TsaC/SUA5/YrdC
VRVPLHAVALALLEEHGEPMLSATLSLPGASAPLSTAEEIRDALDRQLDLIIDGGPCGSQATTVVDLTAEVPAVLRVGKGAVDRIGREEAL